jgi:acyl-CoA thioesterase-2
VSPLEERLGVQAHPGHVDTFVGQVPPGAARLFGGLVVAQALHAAWHTIHDGEIEGGEIEGGKAAHSLHASFLATGRVDEPLRHRVERTRDGSSFATRRVVVDQAGTNVLVLTAGFHRHEAGEDYPPRVPLGGLPAPDALGPGRYDDELFDSRDVPPEGGPAHRRLMWGRARGPVPGGRRWASIGLAYHSDHGPTRAAREPHADHPGVEGRMSVSLDHSIWFLREARLDGWLLSTFTPVSTAAGRGLVHGTIHTADGQLVAAVAQEVVLRL